MEKKSLTTRVLKRSSRFLEQTKYFFRDIAWSAGLNHSFFQNARGARILVYHGICRQDHLRFNTLFLTKERFESQLKFYKKYFNVISLDDYYQEKFSAERFDICLSFDDGFANNYKYVLPLLEEYEVPATFFITAIQDAGYDILWNDVMAIAYKYGPERISFGNDVFGKKGNRDYVSFSTGQRLVNVLRSTELNEKAVVMRLLNSLKEKVEPDYWLQMTKEEIKRLSESKWVTIGSHSYFHHDLTKMSAMALRKDLIHSKRFLESSIGKEIKALAFPYGSYNEQVILESKNAGFTQLLTTEFLSPGSHEDSTLRERLTVNPFISVLNQMYANVNGRY